MSFRYEFFADARDGRIELPEEIASRLEHKGITRLRVAITTAADEEARLALRGIAPETVDRVAGAQRFDRDVAMVVLGAEGTAAGEALAMRLRGILPPLSPEEGTEKR